MNETFIPYVEGNERLRMFIYRDPPTTDDICVRGWCFVVYRQRADLSDWEPIYDAWSQTFSEISLYPALYAGDNSTWIDTTSKKTYSLTELLGAFQTD